MSNESNSSDSDASALPSEVAIPRVVRFWIMLIVYVPSLLSSLFILYHFFMIRTLRQALHNHVIILILFFNLIVQLTGIPWILNYDRLGYVWPQSFYFCMIWILVDEGLPIVITVLFAWATIERHILIFHDRLLSTKKKIIFFHYMPIVLVVLYILCYSAIIILFPPCENTFDYTQVVCGYPLCYYETQLVALWDVVFDHITSATIIISSSVALLLRILYQKNRMRQPIRWRNHRKMTIQLLSISVMFLVVYIPSFLMDFIHLCGVPDDVGANFSLYADYFFYYGFLLLPFVCAGSMPELQAKIKNIFLCGRRQRQVIAPQTMAMSCMTGGRQFKTSAVVPRQL